MNKFGADYREKENYMHDTDLIFRKGHIYSTIVQENLKYINKNVLHVGCNTGSTTKLLDLHINGVTAIDINEEAIDKARELYPELKFDVGNILDLPYDDESFDGIYSLDVLEHIYEEDVEASLKELVRVLKSGSYLFVFTPTIAWEHDHGGTRANPAEPTHVFHMPNESSVDDHFLKHPLKIINVVIDKRKNPSQSIAPGSHNHWSILCQKL